MPPGALLDAASQVLKQRKLRVADLRLLLEAPFAGGPIMVDSSREASEGIASLRSVALSSAKDLVHRMSPDAVVCLGLTVKIEMPRSVMQFMALYPSEDQEELLAELLDRAEMKSFRFSPQEGLQLLHAMVELDEYNENLASYFVSQAALDISPYSVQEREGFRAFTFTQELCTWADIPDEADVSCHTVSKTSHLTVLLGYEGLLVPQRLDFWNQKLLSVSLRGV